MPTRSQSGFSLLELLVALTVFTLVFISVLAVYDQGNSLAAYVQSNIEIHDNVRLAMQHLEQDFRMIGFGLPEGAEIGGTAFWTPAVFHSSPTEIGFRAEIDSGNALITCTPRSANLDCPLNELQVDFTGYYDALNCRQPDDPLQNLPLVVVSDGNAWQGVDCSGVDVSNSSISVSALTDDTFKAKESEVLSIEQIYYRYVARSQPPYGYLQRYVRYDNQPDNVFPPVGVTWSVVANHLTDFNLTYEDGGGPVAKIIITMEGYNTAGPPGSVQLIRIESEVLVRNARF